MAEVPGAKHAFEHRGMVQSLPNGQLAFFHRTAFYSKMFPHCLGKNGSYCHLDWFTVPLKGQQWGHAFKPGIFAFDASEIDTSTHKRCNISSGYPESMLPPAAAAVAAAAPVAGATSSGVAVEVDVDLTAFPERFCNLTHTEAATMPIVAFPASIAPPVEAALQASYAAFEEVRQALKARRRARSR